MVGYQLIPVPPKFSVFTPTFQGVGGQVLDITTVEICDENGKVLDEMFGEVGIQKMSEDGAGDYLDMISYIPAWGGWCDDNGAIDPDIYTFRNGEAVCVNNDWGETVYFKVSGEVDLINKNLVTQGFSFWGNSTPVAIDLVDVRIVNAQGEDIEDMFGEVSVQAVDDAGDYLDIISFIPAWGGWCDDNGAIDRDKFPLKPGEAVCVNNDWKDDDVVYFSLPNPVK